MPTWGKRSSPQDMIGQHITRVEHKVLSDGEHQVWFYAHKVNWVFFQPIGCCNRVSVSVMNNMIGKITNKVLWIDFDNGEYHIDFGADGTCVMQWRSSKVGKNMTIDMIKLSKQEIE